MPITRKVEATYYDSAGRRHASIQEAQLAELEELINKTDGSVYIGNKANGDSATSVLAGGILNEAEAYIAILTTGPRSRPKARKAAGTTSPKRAIKRATQEQALAGIQAMRDAANGQGAIEPDQAAS